MKVLDFTGLKENKQVVEGLNQLLADLQLTYTNLRGLHWNIKGKQFFGLHGKFEQLYDDISEKIDEVAERLLMLDATPAHNFSDYLKTATIKETGVISTTDESVKLVLDMLKTLVAEERSVLEAASEAGDETTVALMGDYIAGQEKHIWMLASFLA